MNLFLKLPFYAKVTLTLIGLYVFVTILSIAGSLLIPLLFAGIIAVLLSPAVHFLFMKKINRTLSISIVLFVVSLLFISLMILLSTQATNLKDSFPQLQIKFNEFYGQAISWISAVFNTEEATINSWMLQAKEDLLNSSNTAISITLSSVGNGMAMIFLIPVYTFMILYYQHHLLQFIRQVAGRANKEQTTEILTETKSIIQHYLVGLFFEFLIIAALNTIGLLLLGIKYAFLLGIAGAMLNIIPYIGGLIALVVFMMIALVTKSPIHVLYVALLYSGIQFVDNNFIVPKIIGAKVKLNALISLIAVIGGAALWGISGMFLSIPVVAILKLISDKIDVLNPLGFLLGESIQPKATFFRQASAKK
jgi:predicted PurR-regulated permease PerM